MILVFSIAFKSKPLLEFGLCLTNQAFMLYDNSKRVIDPGQRLSPVLEPRETDTRTIVSFAGDHIVQGRTGVLKSAFIQTSVRWDLRV